MSNRQDNSPSLDYFELRRRHEEYKNRERLASKDRQDGADQAEPVRARPKAQTRPAAPVAGEAVDAAADAAEDAVEAVREAAEPVVDRFVNDAAADGGFIDDEYSGEATQTGDYDEDFEDEDFEDEDDGEDAGNPNPFDSILKVFHGLKGRLSRDKGRDADEDFEDDGLYDDEAYDEPGDVSKDAGELAEGAPEEAGGDAQAAAPEDIGDGEADGGWRARRRQARRAAPEDEDIDDAAIDDGDYADDDEDFDDDEAEDGEAGGFKKFLRLFVVPIDADEDGDADDEDDDEYDEDYGEDDEDGAIPDGAEAGEAVDVNDIVLDYDIDVPAARKAGPRHRSHAEADDIEGGLDMADQNRVNSELTNQLAGGVEGTGMSRRERRELAARLAAEKAAREAAENAGAEAVEAADALAEAAEAAVEEAEDAVEDLFSEQPLEPDAIEDVADGIVSIDTAADDEIPAVDEPTREFKPVSKVSLDDFMDEIEDDDEDEDDEDDEDEEDEKPVRRGLFGFRRRARDYDDEDDDEDDEEDDDDDDDDDDEDVKPRRGLFGRRASKYDEDDDDDEDEDDDEDDEDEDERPSRSKSRVKGRKGRRKRYDDDDDDYDEDDYDDEDDDYDDYDEDDYDDDDDFDDDDDDAGFGHALLGVLKGFLTAVIVVLVIVIALNVLDVFNVLPLDKVAAKMPPSAVRLAFPSQSFKSNGSGNTGAITGVDAFNAAGSDNAAVSTENFGDDEDFGGEDFDDEPFTDDFDDGEFTEDFGEDSFEEGPAESQAQPADGGSENSVG